MRRARFPRASALLLVLALGATACSNDPPSSGSSLAPDTTDQAPQPTASADSEADAGSTPIDDPPAEETTVDEGPALVAVDPAAITATASSFLAPVGSFTYGAENTIDGNPQTAWNHDNSSAGLAPEGQFLRYRFSSPVTLARIDIVNGYAQDEASFSENARVKSLVVRPDTGDVEVMFPLLDTSEVQRLEHDFGTVNEVTLIVESVYPGSEYRDVAISEVTFQADPGL